jgi:hypothetical protein
LTSLPPVFTSHCCKLVSDHFSIFFGNTNRLQRFPKLQAIRLSRSRASFDRNRWQLSRVVLIACLAF